MFKRFDAKCVVMLVLVFVCGILSMYFGNLIKYELTAFFSGLFVGFFIPTIMFMNMMNDAREARALKLISDSVYGLDKAINVRKDFARRIKSMLKEAENFRVIDPGGYNAVQHRVESLAEISKKAK